MARSLTTYRYYRRNTFRFAHQLGRGSRWNAWVQANINAGLPARIARARHDREIMARVGAAARNVAGWTVNSVRQAMVSAVNAFYRTPIAGIT